MNVFDGLAVQAVYKKIQFAIMRKMDILFLNNTRQGYAPRSTLKPAGSFFLGGSHAV